MSVIKLLWARGVSFFFTVLVIISIVMSVEGRALAAPTQSRQQSFSSPVKAVKALFKAVKRNDDKALARILGPGSEQLINSGDPVADRLNRESFLKLYLEKHQLSLKDGDKSVLSLGNDDFQFPIPLIRSGEGWIFDTAAGKQEILSRRIGRNELAVMDTLHAYVEAQREYSRKDHDGNGVLEFALRINSSPGKQDGLYWEVKGGEEPSPLGLLAAQADSQGYGKQFRAVDPEPFHGYYFKVLTEQGPSADGGAFDYVVHGKMVLGFALVAYPAIYRSSGVMTFIVNQSGIIYQKDFGDKGAGLVTGVNSFDPDSTWKKVE